MKKQIIKIAFILLLTISITPGYSQQSRSLNPAEEDMSDEDVSKGDGISWLSILVIAGVIYSVYWTMNKENKQK